MTSTVVIGLGNPILSDDAIGIHVARALANEIGVTDAIDVKELHAGGMRVMDAIDGYDNAVIVDAMCTGALPPGTVRELNLADLGAVRNLASMHDTNLPTALALGEILGMQMPARVTIYGIEALDVETFGETLSEGMERSVSEAVRLIRGKVQA